LAGDLGAVWGGGPYYRRAGVSATEHGRARSTIEQLQARIEELEEELTEAKAKIELLTAKLQGKGGLERD
jgi:predicted RNase H-like nuclease (RuvC/YqgF family)